MKKFIIFEFRSLGCMALVIGCLATRVKAELPNLVHSCNNEMDDSSFVFKQFDRICPMNSKRLFRSDDDVPLTLEECADLCYNTDDCRYISFGVNDENDDDTGLCIGCEETELELFEGIESFEFCKDRQSTEGSCNGEEYMLLHAGHRCPKDDEMELFRDRGNSLELHECAVMCNEHEDCQYFTYGHQEGHGSAGSCIGCREHVNLHFTAKSNFDLYKLCLDESPSEDPVTLPDLSGGNEEHGEVLPNLVTECDNYNNPSTFSFKAPIDMACPLDDKRLFRTQDGEPLTLEACAIMCLDTEGCHYFSYGDDPENDDHKGVCIGCQQNELVSEPGFDSYEFCKNKESAIESGCDGEQYVLLRSRERCPKGMGLSLFHDRVFNTVDECAEKCNDHIECQFFTYGSYDETPGHGTCIGCKAEAEFHSTPIDQFDLFELCLDRSATEAPVPFLPDDSSFGAIPCISTSMDLTFENSELVENNLGSLGPSNDASSAIRYQGVGTVDGQSIDLIINVKAGHTYARVGGNGFSCPGDTTSSGDCNSGNFGSINLRSGEETTLVFSFVNGETNDLVKVPEFYFSVFDIDQSNSVTEKYGITGFQDASFDTNNDEATFTLGEGTEFCNNQPVSNGNCLFAEATKIGKGCDNPIDPMDLGEFNCNNNEGDTSLRSFLLYYKNTNQFEVHWKTPCTKTRGCGEKGRNFLFSFRSGLAQRCVPVSAADVLTSSPTPCVLDECSICDGPGKYTCCDGVETCYPETCPQSKPISVCIALDESGSVCNTDVDGCPNWNVHMKSFARNLITGLDGVADTEFAVVSFARHGEVDQTLSSASVAKEVIKNLPYKDGWTNTQAAIDLCRLELEKADNDRIKYMVLITDGLPTNNKANVPNPTCDACKTEARAEADLAKAADISIVTVGVRTASYNEQLLGQIASPEMFFSVTGDYDELYTEIKEVNKAANSCIQMARTESPTPCGEDECGVLCGPGKYLCCDGLRVCNPAHCRRSKPVSVCVALDESGSVCKHQGPGCPNWYTHTKGFAKKLIKGLDGVSDAMFAVVSFARRSEVDQSLSDASFALQTIDDLEYRDGWTNTQGAIEMCREELANAPDDHLTYLVLVTDGAPTVDKSNNVGHRCASCVDQTKAEAQAAKDAGIEVITVGVQTSLFNATLLQELASSPDLYFAATNFEELGEKIDYVNGAANICQDDYAED